jgi:hypothetical protein
VAWADVLVGSGSALAGAALQQVLARRNEERKRAYQERDQARLEQYHVFVDLVKSARRVQRAVADLALDANGDQARATLRKDVDGLSEAVAVVRLVTPDEEVIAAVESFEKQAVDLDREGGEGQATNLRLAPMIDAMRSYDEERRPPLPGETERSSLFRGSRAP